MPLIANASGQQIRYVDSTPPGAMQDGSAWASPYPNLQLAIDWAWNFVTGNPTAQVQIWVAEGTYQPTKEMVIGKPESKSFHLPPNTRLIGGFVGSTVTNPLGEQGINFRPGNLFTQTILEGKTATGRVSHVVYCSPAIPVSQSLSQRAEVDGFRIINGLAVGTGDDRNGAGVFAKETDLVIRNCEFQDNAALSDGGAIYWDPGAEQTQLGIGVAKSRFIGNGSLMGKGGAIYAKRPNRLRGLGDGSFGSANPLGTIPHIHNCEFDANIGGRSDASGSFANQGGGAVYLYHPGVQFSFDGSVFSYNEARGNGSAVLLEYELDNNAQSPQGVWLTNCTFYGNQAKGVSAIPADPNAREGGVVYNASGGTATPPSHLFQNNILWGNTVTGDPVFPGSGMLFGFDIMIPEANFRVKYCDIQGSVVWNSTVPVTPTMTNISVDPLFVNPALNDFRLQTGMSPCINTGVLTGAVDHGDVDDDLVFHLQTVPFAPDIPSLFFKAPTTGIVRFQGGLMDRGAMEQ